MDKKYLRQLTLETRSLDDQARTVSAVLSTETPVTRTIDGELVDEILSHKSGAVDLSRAPLPLIESHDMRRVNIGTVEGLRLDGDKLRGRVRLGSSARATELWADIKNGIVSGLSIGYQVKKFVQEGTRDAMRIIATSWQPFEVSLVSVPADPQAGLNRSMSIVNTVTLTTREKERRDEIDAYISTRKYQDRPEVEAIGAKALANGWTLERTAKEYAEFCETLIEETPVSRATPQQPYGGRSMSSEVVFSGEGDDDLITSMTDALVTRAGFKLGSPHPAARDFQRTSLAEMQRILLRRAGVHAHNWSNRDLVNSFISSRSIGSNTSNFTDLLANVLTKTIDLSLEEFVGSWGAWVPTVPVPTFHQNRHITMSGAPGLDEIPEGSNYRIGGVEDAAETYQVKTYGKIFSLSRQALINDELGWFAQFPQAFVKAARRTQDDLVYAVLTANAAMSDGNALFSTAHSNIVTAGATPSVDTLNTLRGMMRKQKTRADSAGNQGYLGAVPRYLIVPPELETTAHVLASSTQMSRIPTGVSGSIGESTAVTEAANLFGDMQVVTEPRLSDSNPAGWYIAADNVDHIKMAILSDSSEGISVESNQLFEKDGISYKVRFDGCAFASAWEGVAYNDGA